MRLENSSNHRCQKTDAQSGALSAAAILEERARALAQPVKGGASQRVGLEVVVFRFGREHYGIEARLVNRVHHSIPITPIPQTPAHFLGVGNFRGEPLCLFDLARILRAGSTDLSAATGLLVIGEEEAAEFGFPVDEVTGVRVVGESDLHTLPESGGESDPERELLRGVTSDALGILDGEALLRHPLTAIDSKN